MARMGAGISEQHAASYRRWEDAKALHAAMRWQGAMYMAGYAVECALKATLMREFGVRTLSSLDQMLTQRHGHGRSMFTHDIELLFGLTRLGHGITSV